MSTNIPIQLQSALNFESLHEGLIVMRQKLTLADSQVQSATISIKKAFKDLVTQFFDLINEMLRGVEVAVIPEEDFANFLLGLRTLDEFADFDTLDYYHGLLNLRFIASGYTAALLELQEVQPKALFPSVDVTDGVLDTLTEEEFTDQGFTSPVVDAVPEFDYYKVVDGDTLLSIAQRQMGDHLAYGELVRANPGLSDVTLRQGIYQGNFIKIPLDTAQVASRLDASLVYEPSFDGADQKSVARFFYGRDFALAFDGGRNNGKFIIDGTGDLANMEGITCAIQNVQDRFRIVKGGLNPLTPDFGLLPPYDPTGVPLAIFLENLFVDMESQAVQDPRVLSATVIRDRMQFIGDKLTVPMQIRLLSGSTHEVFIENPQAAVL